MYKKIHIILGCVVIVFLIVNVINIGTADAQLNIVRPLQGDQTSYIGANPAFCVQWSDTDFVNFNYNAKKQNGETYFIWFWQDGLFDERIAVSVEGIPIWFPGQQEFKKLGFEAGETYNCIVLKVDSYDQIIVSDSTSFSFADGESISIISKAPNNITPTVLLGKLRKITKKLLVSEAHAASVFFSGSVYGYVASTATGFVDICDGANINPCAPGVSSYLGGAILTQHWYCVVFWPGYFTFTPPSGQANSVTVNVCSLCNTRVDFP